MKDLREAQISTKESDAHLQILIGQIATGDRQAFRELYDRVRTTLFYCALKVVRRRETAEDVLQEAFLAIWRLAPNFQADRGSAMAWMMVITRTRAVDSLRRRAASRENLTFDFDEEQEENLIFDQPNLDNALDLKRRYALACWGLGQLRATHRQVLTLKFLNEMTYSEVSMHSGMPIGTVKTYVRRALKNLRETLTADLAPGIHTP